MIPIDVMSMVIPIGSLRPHTGTVAVSNDGRAFNILTSEYSRLPGTVKFIEDSDMRQEITVSIYCIILLRTHYSTVSVHFQIYWDLTGGRVLVSSKSVVQEIRFIHSKITRTVLKEMQYE